MGKIKESKTESAGGPAARHPRCTSSLPSTCAFLPFTGTRSIAIANDKKAKGSASKLQLEDGQEDGYADYGACLYSS